jgi:hypothetical protein
VAKARHADQVGSLQEIPNVGPAAADDLRALDIFEPAQLCGQDPYELFERLARVRGEAQDPCVCDVLIAAVRFMEGGPARPWWFYTSERKRRLAEK